MALPKVKADATEARLAGLTLPDTVSDARQSALARVSAMGLPHNRDEYWRFTNPRTLVQPEAPLAEVAAVDGTPLWDDVDRVRIVFVDGVFNAERSDDLKAAGLEIAQLSDALSADISWAKDLYGTLEARGQKPVDRPFAALNTAMATEGVAIRATAKAEKPVNLIYERESQSADPLLHTLIKVDSGADMTVLETGAGGARFSSVIEVDVGEGGAFHHVRDQGRDHERRVLTHCFAQVAAKATFKSFTLSVNGALTRNECVIDIRGDDAIAHVAGACVGDGKGFHHDDTIFVTHDAVNCESRQVFKKVLRNGATGVFQGKILVKAGAQKTDGYQISQSLMLDDDSQFLAKPELEIYADDVACSHGSTSGAIDETALFYLQSRGVPRKQATDLLTLAFLAESLQEIEDDTLAEALRDRLAGWLERHATV